jgi:hypothetical protein
MIEATMDEQKTVSFLLDPQSKACRRTKNDQHAPVLRPALPRKWTSASSALVTAIYPTVMSSS